MTSSRQSSWAMQLVMNSSSRGIRGIRGGISSSSIRPSSILFNSCLHLHLHDNNTIKQFHSSSISQKSRTTKHRTTQYRRPFSQNEQQPTSNYNLLPPEIQYAYTLFQKSLISRDIKLSKTQYSQLLKLKTQLPTAKEYETFMLLLASAPANNSSVAYLEKVFQDMMYQTSIRRPLEGCYQALFTIYAQQRDYTKMDSLFDKMIQLSHTPSPEFIQQILNLYVHLTKPNYFISRKDMTQCSITVGRIYSQIFHRVSGNDVLPPVHQPVLETFRALIMIYKNLGDMKSAIGKYEDMLQWEIPPTRAEFNILLDGYAKAGDENGVDMVMSKMRQVGEQPDTATYNSLLAMYVRQDQLGKAEELFKKLVNGEIVVTPKSNNTKSSSAQEKPTAIAIHPTIVTYNVMMNLYIRLEPSAEKALTKIRDLFTSLIDIGLEPDEFAFKSLMHAYLRAKDFDGLEKAFAYASNMGYAYSKHLWRLRFISKQKSQDIQGALALLEQVETNRWFPIDPRIHEVILNTFPENESQGFTEYYLKAFKSSSKTSNSFKPTHKTIRELISRQGDDHFSVIEYYDEYANYNYKPFLSSFRQLIKSSCQVIPDLEIVYMDVYLQELKSGIIRDERSVDSRGQGLQTRGPENIKLMEYDLAALECIANAIVTKQKEGNLDGEESSKMDALMKTMSLVNVAGNQVLLP